MSTRMSNCHASWESPTTRVPLDPSAPALDLNICYYCKRDRNMCVTVKSAADSQQRVVTVIEVINDEVLKINYGVCPECAIRYGIGQPQKDSG